jgi:UDP-2,4-diacetamido-2,4,6-trideoxy-beta-L-altropyranose hydrolase
LGAEEVCVLMKNSHVGICSASTVSYEYCSVGGLLFIVKTASNQEKLYNFLIKEELALDFKNFKNAHKNQAESFIKNQKRYFNGRSIRNIQKIFKSLAIEDKLIIRKALAQDSKIYFDWANDPTTRKNSINKQSIKWEDHERWFSQKLLDKNTHLFLFSIRDNLFGQIRFDKIQDYWLISFSVDKNYRGEGLAEIMVHKGIAEFRKTLNGRFILKAQVWDQNVASSRIFKNLNFKMVSSQIINDEKFCDFIKNID